MMLTARQRAVLQFIVTFQRENGCPPSIPEIQREFGIRSPNGVAGHLRLLERKGFIRRADRGSRQIEVTGPGHTRRNALCDLPVFGAIPAGFPQTFEDARAESCITLDEQTLGFHPAPGSFALRVRGDSMAGAGILNGDMVIVEPGRPAREGQIVAALVDGESTLKRLVRIDGVWSLRAENPAYPQIYSRSELTIQGAVRTVIRRVN
jgi:repressor LexA